MAEDDARTDSNQPEDLPGQPFASPATPASTAAETPGPAPALGPAQFPAAGWAQPPGSWGAATAYPAPGWGYVPGYQPGSGPWSAPRSAPRFAPGFQPGLPPGYMPLPYAPPGPMPGLSWGGIGARLGALVIDAVLLAFSLFALGLVISAMGPTATGRSGNVAATAVALVWWLFVLIYHPGCWYVFGATLGQKALGLRVAQAADGQSLSIDAVIVRYLIFFTVTLAFPLGVVSAAIAARDPFKRAWHDELARTVVVKK